MTGKIFLGKEIARVQEAVHTVLNVKVSGLFIYFLANTIFTKKQNEKNRHIKILRNPFFIY